MLHDYVLYICYYSPISASVCSVYSSKSTQFKFNSVYIKHLEHLSTNKHNDKVNGWGYTWDFQPRRQE